jgi:glutathione synthase/RimK-type ligase-like ATP-grasp enzyme
LPGRVAFAASRDMLALDAGWPLLRDAVAGVGLEPTVAAWEDATVDWAAFDLVVANYTWGYVLRRERFLEWAETVAARTRLVNPEPVLRWNSDKSYLADLAAAGVPTVPTTRVPPGAGWEPPARDYVIKPSVSSGAIEAARYVAQGVEAARAHVERLHRLGQTVLVQPYLRGVDDGGETALVHFGGGFSHALGKDALLEPDAGTIFGLWERQVVTPRSARADQHAVAERALRAVHERVGPTAYARVDLVDGDDGHPVVMEVELVEPSLFLDLAPGAAERLADVLRGRLTEADRAPPPAARPGTG